MNFDKRNLLSLALVALGVKLTGKRRTSRSASDLIEARDTFWLLIEVSKLNGTGHMSSITFPSFRISPSQLPATMSSCDCDRKNTNGGNCDSSCKECEPTFVFETTSSPKMFYAPVVVASKAAGVATVEAAFSDIGQ
ncbi:hypothetical protein R1sor_010191 [Riccia sorocarpa]|uniref:Uncharacterized protein n=1 Tax=Riccia sorocarpa TaxID=122646 RepID=A0ABD3I0V3_9MARC